MVEAGPRERIRRRLARGEKRKRIAAAEGVSLAEVYRAAEVMWREARDALREAATVEPTRRCGGCGMLLYESVKECLRCKIAELEEEDLRAWRRARELRHA